MLQPEPADHSVLTTLFQHNTWANLKLLDFCEALSDEQLATAGIGTYGSIRATLPHLVGAEVSYVHRVNGKWPAEPWPEDGFPGFVLLKQTAQWTGNELLQLALSARADSLVQEEDDKVVVRYPLASLLMQALNHATEHRTQVSTILTQLGLEPPDMTGWQYMDEKSEFKETAKAAS